MGLISRSASNQMYFVFINKLMVEGGGEEGEGGEGEGGLKVGMGGAYRQTVSNMFYQF